MCWRGLVHTSTDRPVVYVRPARNSDSYISILPIRIGRPSVVLLPPELNTDVRDVTFASRAAREFPRTALGTGSSTIYTRAIHIKNVNNLPWKNGENEIEYQVVESDKALLDTFDEILATFRFTT